MNRLSELSCSDGVRNTNNGFLFKGYQHKAECKKDALKYEEYVRKDRERALQMAAA